MHRKKEENTKKIKQMKKRKEKRWMTWDKEWKEKGKLENKNNGEKRKEWKEKKIRIRKREGQKTEIKYKSNLERDLMQITKFVFYWNIFSFWS